MDGCMQRLMAAMRAERSRHRAAADFYRGLAAGQAPGVVVICCSDSRAAPEHIMQAGPGELFVQRSVAGLIPPPPNAVERAWLGAYRRVTRLAGMPQLAGAWYGPWAAIEYPVVQLGVPNILVLGHSGCGGIGLACRAKGSVPALHDTDCWVDMVRPALRPVLRDAPAASAGRAAEEAAILWSRANLLRHPGIAARVASGATAIHAAHYDIESGTVRVLDPAGAAFLPLALEDERTTAA